MSAATLTDAPAAEPADLAKRKAHITALAALAGCSLYELAGGGYLLCRWGMARELPDLGAVASLLRQMGAAV